MTSESVSELSYADNQLIESKLPQLLSKITGSVFPSLSSSDIKDFPVARPSAFIGEAFSSETHQLLELQDHLSRESVKRAALRNYLLPKLLSGEVRVRETQSS